jgi:thioredoxin-like negative regulator of GroEL
MPLASTKKESLPEHWIRITEDNLAYVSQGPILIHFWQDWCEKCKATRDYLREPTGFYVGDFEIAYDDPIRKELEIMAIPTLILFMHGKEIHRFAANLKFELDLSDSAIVAQTLEIIEQNSVDTP